MAPFQPALMKEVKVKWFKRFLRVTVLAYLGFAIGLYMLQEKLIFHAEPVDFTHKYEFQNPTKDIWITNHDAMLHGILFKGSSINTKGVVLYFKGNMGNVSGSERLAGLFLRMGYDVISMDYRGSGKSRGPLSETKLLKDAELWYDWATSNYGLKVRVVGYSLGTTFASHIAGVRAVSHTILFAPMSSIEEVALYRYPFIPWFITRYPFRSYEKLKQAVGQVDIFHGTDDKVIPFKLSAALREVLGADDLFHAVEGGTHYNIATKKEVVVGIAERWL